VRDLILNEIRRLVVESGGRPPGQIAFTKATGITAAKWNGVLWAKWSDALIDAGFAPNAWQGRLDSADLLSKVAVFCQKLGRMPTKSEMKLHRTINPTFPSITRSRLISRPRPNSLPHYERLRSLMATPTCFVSCPTM
jgi:hypothetical protein